MLDGGCSFRGERSFRSSRSSPPTRSRRSNPPSRSTRSSRRSRSTRSSPATRSRRSSPRTRSTRPIPPIRSSRRTRPSRSTPRSPATPAIPVGHPRARRGTPPPRSHGRCLRPTYRVRRAARSRRGALGARSGAGTRRPLGAGPRGPARVVLHRSHLVAQPLACLVQAPHRLVGAEVSRGRLGPPGGRGPPAAGAPDGQRGSAPGGQEQRPTQRRCPRPRSTSR